MISYALKALGAATILASAIGAPAFAAGGNIVLTGHDNDYHAFYGDPNAAAALSAEAHFIANGSLLPLLTFDQGSELTATLTALGIAYVNVDPTNAASVTDSLFNHSIYSGFAVASEYTCGGCDNTPAGVANIASHLSSIASFVSAGGGVLGLAGAADPLAYAYVPTAATNGGGFPPAFGFTQTAAGAALGLPAVNGDPTHNYFPTPGTAGLSSLFVATEVNGSNVETVALQGATITCTGSSCGITGGGGGVIAAPEIDPASFGSGITLLLGALAVFRGRRTVSLEVAPV